MLKAQTECLTLDTTATISLDELAECCGMSAADIEELVEYSALTALDTNIATPRFSAHWVTPLRSVAKLRLDFDLDLFAAAIVLSNLDRIAQLERRVQSLQALLPHHHRVVCHE